MGNIWETIKAWILGLFTDFWATKKTYIIITGAVVLAFILLGLFVPASRPYIAWLGTAGLWILKALQAIAGILFYILSLPAKLLGR